MNPSLILQRSGKETIAKPLPQKIADGDKYAIHECVKKYGDLIWKAASKVSDSPTKTEDIALDIFQEIWENCDNFDRQTTDEVTFISLIIYRNLRNRRNITKEISPIY